MESPLYDVIVENIPGATDPATSPVDLGSERIATFQEEDPSVQPASVVQTRSPVKATRAKPFQELKKRISSPPILRLPNVGQPFVLQINASHLGVGAVLLQEDTAGEKRPIAFASRKLLPRESRYSTIEPECLSITWGVKKFQEYLYGTEFILETDHQPFQYLRQAKFQNGRLLRWALALQP